MESMGRERYGLASIVKASQWPGALWKESGGNLGYAGLYEAKLRRTTIRDMTAIRAKDLVSRDLVPMAPGTVSVADFTYVSTWSGWVCGAFVIDAYARRILGWSASLSMTSRFVLDALDQAIWTRQRAGDTDLAGLIQHTDARAQYTALAFAKRLAETGTRPSTATVDDSYDNPLAQTINGLYKTKLIKPGKP